MAYQTQRTSLRINRKNRDAVVSSIRGIQEFAGRMDLDLCPVACAGKPLGQSGNGLQILQSTVLGIVAERADRRVQFVDRVSIAAVRMKSEMPGPSAGSNARRLWLIRCERPLGLVETIDKNFVEPKVCDGSKAVTRIEVDRVGVRP